MVYRQRDQFERPSPQAVQDVLGLFATRAGMSPVKAKSMADSGKHCNLP